MPLRFILVSVFAVFLAGCTSPSAQLQQSKQVLDSWSGTIDMVEEQWNKHTVPYVYVRKTLHAADQELEKQSEAIRSLKVSAREKQLLIEEVETLKRKSGKVVKEANAVHTREK